MRLNLKITHDPKKVNSGMKMLPVKRIRFFRNTGKRNVSDKEPVSEHLKMLRHTIIGCLAAITVGMVVCYGLFIEQLMMLILKPLEGLNTSIVYISVTESFTTEMKAGLIAGIILASPVVFFLIWRFIAPAFFPKEQWRIALYTLIAVALFCSGVVFCYLILLPYMLLFFATVGATGIQAMITISNYLDFFCKVLLAFGAVFETPLLTYFLVRFHIVSAAKLRKIRKYILLVCFILGAIITPPDVISQLYVAVPMYLMYEIGMLAAALTERREAKRVPEAQNRKAELPATYEYVKKKGEKKWIRSKKSTTVLGYPDEIF